MKRYGNLHGNSGIAAYEEGADFIRIRFTSGSVYLYTRTRVHARKILKR